MKWLVGLLGVVLGLAGCTGSNSKSCLDGTCGDPARPYCDVDGALSGTPGLCVSVDCTPSAFQMCRGDSAVICNDTGTNYDVTQCENGCGPVGCRRCVPNASSCGENDALFMCDADGLQLAKIQDCQYGCTTDRCNACAASTTFCSGDDLVMCTSGGEITNPMTCQFGCQGMACNACTPNTTFCQGSNAITCSAGGQVGSSQSCGAAGCQSGVCNTCSPSTTTCQGDNLVVCNAGGTIQNVTACALGCTTTAGAHCKALVPSFGVPAPSGSLPDLTINGDAVLDITNCSALDVKLTNGATTTAVPATQLAVVSQSSPGAPPICIVKYGSISIPDPFVLNVVNSGSLGHVLSLAGTGDITIGGKITFLGSALGPSPGTSVSAVGTNSTGKYTAPGAGGGGGAFAGGNGGTCAACGSGGTDVPGGAGGPAFTFSNTLFGGSKGGGVGFLMVTQAIGGSGGGGLHLVSLTRVTFAASSVINLNGEGGRVPFGHSGPWSITAGGGGSGGMLVVEAPVVNVSTGAIAAANGGGGAGAGYNSTFSGGLIVTSPAYGQSGQLSATRAAGGDLTMTGSYGDGGFEADGAAFPSANGLPSDSGAANYGGGGGGGSRGFIVLRARAAANVMIAFGSVISPAPALGAVTAQ